MSNAHFSTTLARFEGTVQRTKNRLIAVPGAVQRRLGLARRPHNHILLYSIRRRGRGRWNHHWAQLTRDNAFAVPADVARIRPGDHVEVKIHRVVPDVDALDTGGRFATPGGLLSAIAADAGEEDRVDGSLRVDEYLYAVTHG